MTNSTLAVWQVKEIRRRCWRGESPIKVADDMGLSRGPVYTAARGLTWASVIDPPPIPLGTMLEAKKHRTRQTRTCGNCGESYRGGTTTRCGGCYTWLKRYGTEKPSDWNRNNKIQLSAKVLRHLYEQYKMGVSTEALAEGKSFSSETLRRRFREAGYPLRTTTGCRQKLNAGLVRQARELVYGEGRRISDLAHGWGINYMTLYSAVVGDTWQSAGGPLPHKTDGESSQPCKRCSLLTVHPSGLCTYCRQK